MAASVGLYYICGFCRSKTKRVATIADDGTFLCNGCNRPLKLHRDHEWLDIKGHELAVSPGIDTLRKCRIRAFGLGLPQ